MWTVNSQRQPADNQLNCEDVSAHQRFTDCVDANSVALLNSVQNPIDGQTHQNPSLEHQIASLDSNNLESSVTDMQQESRSSPATTTATVLATRTAGVDTVVSCDIADGADVETIVVVDDDDDASSEANPVTKKSSWTAAYKAKVASEIKNELAHPDDVFITAAQYNLDAECAEFAATAHAEDICPHFILKKTITQFDSILILHPVCDDKNGSISSAVVMMVMSCICGIRVSQSCSLLKAARRIPISLGFLWQ